MADLLSLVHLATFLVYLGLIIFLLGKNPDSSLNRVCAAFIACFAIWCLGKIFIHRVDVPLSSTVFFMNLVIVGAWSFGGVFLWFTCLLTERREILSKKLFYVYVLGVPLLAIVHQWLLGGIVEYVPRSYGWGIAWQPSPVTWVTIGHILSSMLIGIGLLIHFRIRTDNRRKRKTADIIILSGLLPMVPGAVVNVLLPAFDVPEVPDLAQNLAIFFALGLVYAIVKYRFMAVTQVTAALNIIATMNEGVLLLDPRGVIITANRAALDQLGRRADQVHGQPLASIVGDELLAPDDRAQLLRGEPLRNQALLLPATEDRRLAMRLSTSVLRDEDRQLAGIVCILTDVTELKAAEEAREKAYANLEVMVAERTAELARANAELQKRDRLRALGVVAGGIAHDFNNLLTGILGNVSLARTADSFDTARPLLAEAEAASKRARSLTGQLLTFSRGGAPVKKLAGLQPLLRDTVSFVLSGSNTRCVFDIPADLSPVEIDAGQISQVLQNLAINADQAMPDGGTLRVTAANVTLEEDNDEHLPPGSYAEISVADEGSGIAPEDADRIFEPYFTRKETGTGLGLAIAYSVLERHGGHITVASEPGAGATFRFYLPASASPESPTVPTASRARPAEHGRVLVMDDESAIRRVAEATLGRHGLEVTTTIDGEEAIAAYARAQEEGRPFDVVLLDLTVPGGMGGLATQGALRQLDPTVRSIASSGYSDAEVASNHEALGFAEFLAKPYEPEALLAAVTRLIEGHRVA
ncbi:ATP-binding protein [Planctomycetota bacterium]